ncbi:MAG: ATP-binding protein [Acidaminobacteraceae bacterium]
MKKLSTKVIFTIIGLTLFTSIVLVSLTYNILTNILEEESHERLLSASNIHMLQIDNELINTENIVKELSYVIETTFDYKKAKESLEYMDEYKKSLELHIKSVAQINSISNSVYVFFVPKLQNRPNDVWYADLDKDGIVTRENEFPISFYDGDTVGKQWFYVPLRTKKPYWTDLYAGNTEDDKEITYISYTSPVIIDGEVIAIVGADYYFDDLITRLESISIYETGYAFIMKDQGEILFHPTIENGEFLQSIEDSKFEDIQKYITSIDHDVFEYVWRNDQKKIMSFNRLRNNMILGITVPKEEVLKDRNLLIKKLLIAIVAIVLVAIIIGYKIGVKIIRPIKEILPEIAAIGEGNYDIRISPKHINREDEIGELINSIEQMRIRQKLFFEKINIQNEKLENNVQRRTEELHFTNEHLESSMRQLEEQKSELITTNKRLGDTLDTVKRTQKQLIDTEKIASLGYLVSGISHEINTPLGNSITIVSFLELELKSIIEKQENESLKKSDFNNFLNVFDESISFLARNLSKAKYLINNFKELAVEKTLDKKTSHNLKSLIEDIITSFELSQSEKLINVEIKCNSALIVEIDSYKLTQILYNLISNSIVHGFEGRSKGFIKIEAEKKYDRLIIRYLDDGVGIGLDHIDDIFTPFFSTKFGESSSGLGLNVVYNIVKSSFAGTIECESQKNMGTSFTLNLKIS